MVPWVVVIHYGDIASNLARLISLSFTSKLSCRLDETINFEVIAAHFVKFDE